MHRVSEDQARERLEAPPPGHSRSTRTSAAHGILGLRLCFFGFPASSRDNEVFQTSVDTVVYHHLAVRSALLEVEEEPAKQKQKQKQLPAPAGVGASSTAVRAQACSPGVAPPCSLVQLFNNGRGAVPLEAQPWTTLLPQKVSQAATKQHLN